MVRGREKESGTRFYERFNTGGRAESSRVTSAPYKEANLINVSVHRKFRRAGLVHLAKRLFMVGGNKVTSPIRDYRSFETSYRIV